METAKTAIIGIDPGSSTGALCTCVLSPESAPVIEAYNMPETLLDIYKSFKVLTDVYGANIFAVIENVGGARPGNAAKAARTFAEHVGALKMALVATGMGSTAVVPRKWMVATCGNLVPTGSSAEAKKERKQYIYEQMQKHYPYVKFTKRQADAVGLMHYGRMLRAEDKLI